MAEIISERIDIELKYNDKMDSTIVESVVSLFDDLYEKAKPHREMIKRVKRLLSIDDAFEKRSEKYFETIDGDKIKLKDANIKQIRDASIAHRYNSIFKTPSQMFSVELETDTGFSNTSEIQKQKLLNILKKSKSKTEFKKMCESCPDKGEAIAFVKWQQKTNYVRRKVTKQVQVMDNPLSQIVSFLGMPPQTKEVTEYEIQEQIVYDGVKIKSIKSENFVFDTSRDDFEKTPKIYQDFLTYNEIVSNTTYRENLSTEDLRELKKYSKTSSNKNNNEMDEKLKKGYRKNQIEVLEYQGDFIFEFDGELIYEPHVQIVVIGRKFLGIYRFNPDPNCSFVYYADEVDEETGRGIPRLAYIATYALAMEDILNKIHKALGLSINKCYIAQRDTFVEEIVNVRENGIIQVDDIDNVLKMKELNFDSALNYALKYLTYLESKMEQFISVYKAQMGEVSGDRTATQAKLTQMGQDNMISFQIDIFSQFVLEMIEKMAEMEANFNSSVEQIKYTDREGNEVIGEIDETIRTQDFIYKIGDTQTSTQKKMDAMDMSTTLLQWLPTLNLQGKTISADWLINIIGSSYDQEHPEKAIIPLQMLPQGGMNGQQGAGAAPAELADVETMGDAGMAGGSI
jgi:hypothetical protein